MFNMQLITVEMLVRSNEWWKERSIADLWVAVYYDDQNKAAGYLSYEVKEEKLKVEEFVPLTSEARFGLWNFICQHDSMVKEVELILNPQEVLPFILKDPRIKIEKVPYFMSRIVDVKGFLELFLQRVENPYHFSLTITDSTASWNNQTFVLNRQEVSEGKECDSSFRLTINAFTSLVFGVKYPS